MKLVNRAYRQYPKTEGGDMSQRAFRRWKRADLRALERAASQLQRACAYMPDYPWPYEKLREAVREIRKGVSEKWSQKRADGSR